MKTTIEIPDELARQAKEVARDDGTSLRDLVVSGLRSEVERRRAPSPAEFSFPVFVGGGGLVDGLDPGDAIARSYEE